MPRRRKSRARRITDRFRKVLRLNPLEEPAPKRTLEDDLGLMTHAPGSLTPKEQAEVAQLRRETDRQRRKDEAQHRETERKLRETERRRQEERERGTRNKKKRKKGNRLTAIFRRTPSSKRKVEKIKETDRRERAGTGSRERPTDSDEKGAGSRQRGGAGRISRRFKAGMMGRTQRMKKVVSRGAINLGHTANLDALYRTFRAFRLSRSKAEPPPHPETGGFWISLPGAFGRVLHPHSLILAGGGAFLVALSVLLVKFVMPLGILACLVVAAHLAALRLDYVDEVCHDRDDVSWPQWEESLAALSIYVALGLLFLPALALGLLAQGPDGSRIPTYAKALVTPSEAERSVNNSAADAAESYKDRAWEGYDEVRKEREAVGVENEDEEEVARRERADKQIEAIRGMRPEGEGGPAPPPSKGGRAVADDSLQELRQLTSPQSGLGKAGVICLAVAMFLFPMALLSASKLKSAYAALHFPLLLRSIVSAPLAYLVVVVVFVAQDIVLVLAITAPYAALSASLEDPLMARVAAVAITAFLMVLLPIVSGSVLGRFYRSQHLGW